MIAENSRSVLSSMLDDIKRAWFITLCIMQSVFIVFYGYSIYSNLNKMIFLVSYSVLTLLSLVTFIVFLVSHHKQKKQNKEFVRTKNFLKYIVNATMLVFNIVELVKFGIDDFAKILLILSGVLLFAQVAMECIKIFAERYIRDFRYAFEKDFEILDPNKLKGNVWKMVDAPLEKFVQRKFGIEKELSPEEARMEEYKRKFREKNEIEKEKKKYAKIEKKAEAKKQGYIMAQKEKQEIKKHLVMILGKGKKSQDQDKKAE